ncbi:hypothetical protein Pla175_07660 [Pirellulimonas nuda]|uniref:Uncharacterized protein n=2 Tax=Pirellulimonas nuda TaxID=2528009 RepID=A0A518D7H5_9BACT|nr:hypothetical protein Pla175_07660 [Pirellulimonas nuda]
MLLVAGAACATAPVASDDAIGPPPGVTITDDGGVDTPGLPGFRTYTLTAQSTGTRIVAFDFVGDAMLPADFGFFGAMNQVHPLGFDTPFKDQNGFFAAVGALPSQDSQFLFVLSDLAFAIPGLSTDSHSRLEAVLALLQPTSSVPFVQLVLPAGPGAGGVLYSGLVALESGDVLFVTGSVGVPVPEPAALVLAGLAGCGAVGVCCRRSNRGRR